jgi:hypothetical protein
VPLGFRRMKAMARHRSHSIEFRRRIVSAVAALSPGRRAAFRLLREGRAMHLP